MIPMKPHEDVPFTRGPAIDDPTLPDWLAAQTRVVRVPVTLQVSDVGRRSDIAIGPVAVSALHDARLGVALDDHLRRHCARPGPCHVWVEGYWDAGERAVGLTRFVRPIAEGEDASFVEVEAAAARPDGAGP